MGKTRLVAAVAEQAASRFPPAALVDLVPVRTVARAGAVGQAVADALDVTEATQSVERAVFERLRLGRPLLVLDNCEHVIDEVSALAERVLATCPQATVLATSRQRLGVPGERLVHVRPLGGTDLEQLFRDRAAPRIRGSPRHRRSWPTSAPGWTACRSRSSWPPPAPPHSAPTGC